MARPAWFRNFFITRNAWASFSKYSHIRRATGKPKVVVLKINTKQMTEDGIKFYLSNNGVWLTEYIGTEYITEI